MGAIVVVSGPALEPVTLAELKEHCRVSVSQDDSYISSLGVAARKMVEDLTGRRLMTQTLRWELDAFPLRDHLLIPVAPVQSIEEVRTFDEDEDDDEGTEMPAADYIVDIGSEPARIVLKSGSYWPTELAEARGIRTTFVCGYAPTASPDAGEAVPAGLKLAIKMLVSTWYGYRETLTQVAGLKEVPGGIDALLGEFQAWNRFGHAAVNQEAAR